MPIQGLRSTADFTVTGQRPQNWREGMLMLEPNGQAPLTALTAAMKSQTTDDPHFHWFEKKLPNQRLQLSADITAAQTTLNVVTGGVDTQGTSGSRNVKAGHLLMIEHSGEIVLVTADPSVANAVTVQRGYAGTTPATVTVATQNPHMFVVGNVHEEGSLAPTGIAYDPVERENYTQIFRNTLEATRTASKTKLRTGEAVREAKRECLQLHMLEMEKALWLGKRGLTTKNGKPARTTGGILWFLETHASGNIINQAGVAIDLLTLEGWMERIFRFGSSEKMVFTGNRALLTIQRIIRKNTNTPYTLAQGQKEFGMNVSRLVCPFGELVLKTHPLFNQLISSATPEYYSLDSWFFVLDMGEFVYRHLTGDDTRYEADLQANGLDGAKSGYLTEMGLELHHPETHFLIKGVANATVDS
jgi:hypothetical protein